MKVGIAICSYNSPDEVNRWTEHLANNLAPLALKDRIELVSVVSSCDDSQPESPQHGVEVLWDWNLGVTFTKNRGLSYLVSQECHYIFLIEEDAFIPDWTWFKNVVEASKDTGIHHLMYGPIDNEEWNTWNLTGNTRTINGWEFFEYRRNRAPQCTPGVVTFVTLEAVRRAGGLDPRFVGRGPAHEEWTDRLISVTESPLSSPLWFLKLSSNEKIEFPRRHSRGWIDFEVERNARLYSSIKAGIVPIEVPNLGYLTSLTGGQVSTSPINEWSLPGESILPHDEPISVCIALKNRVHLLRECLESIKKWFDYDGSDRNEVVIADFESTDCSPKQELERLGIAGRVLRVEDHFVRSRGLHLAATAARNDILVFLDADIVVMSALFGYRVRLSVGPDKCFFPICYGLNQGAPRKIEDGTGFWRGDGFGLTAMTKDFYWKIGGWDRRIRRWGGEDNDLFWYANQMGQKVVRHHTPELIHLWHPESAREKYTDLNEPTLVGQYRNPPDRGEVMPEPCHLVEIPLRELRGSLEYWKFHLSTVKQVLNDPNIKAVDTEYFHGVKNYKTSGGYLWADCTTDAAIIHRVDKFKLLINRIKTEGYDRSRPIKIEIRRGGEIGVWDGHHRAAIADVLGIPSIPAIVHRRHSEWAKLVDAAWHMYRKRKVYQPISHPEFHDWEVARDIKNRTAAISSLENDWRGVEVIDVGACQGGVGYALSDRGAHVTAVDTDSRFVSVGKLIQSNLRPSCTVNWINGDGFEAVSKKKWDWILCLSVLHHVVKAGGREALREKLCLLLSQARKGVVIEMGTGNERQMIGCDIPPSQQDMYPYLHALTPGVRWYSILKGVPLKERKSGSDYRWLFVAHSN